MRCAYCDDEAKYTGRNSSVDRSPMCTAHYARWHSGWPESDMRGPVLAAGWRREDARNDVMLGMRRAGVTQGELRAFLAVPHGGSPDFGVLIERALKRREAMNHDSLTEGEDSLSDRIRIECEGSECPTMTSQPNLQPPATATKRSRHERA